MFNDERLSTEASGKLGVRAGGTALTLSGNTTSTLHRINGGLHVDMMSGSLFFASPENFIIAGGAAVGLTAWGIHEFIESNNGPESPAKP